MNLTKFLKFVELLSDIYWNG